MAVTPGQLVDPAAADLHVRPYFERHIELYLKRHIRLYTDTPVHLLAGAWTTPRGRRITHCPGCGEWLGSAFVAADEIDPLFDGPLK